MELTAPCFKRSPRLAASQQSPSTHGRAQGDSSQGTQGAQTALTPAPVPRGLRAGRQPRRHGSGSRTVSPVLCAACRACARQGHPQDPHDALRSGTVPREGWGMLEISRDAQAGMHPWKYQGMSKKGRAPGNAKGCPSRDVLTSATAGPISPFLALNPPSSPNHGRGSLAQTGLI